MKKALPAIVLFILFFSCGLPVLGQNSLDEQLLRAAMEGRAEAIQPLLSAGANIETFVPYDKDKLWQRDTNLTPLMIAAEYGNLDAVTVLLKNHASIDAVNDRGDTALYRAVFMGRTEVVRLLLQRGAKISSGDGTSLLSSANCGVCKEITQLLLEHGANIEVKGYEDITPLIMAAWKGHSDVVRMLLDKGANVNAKTSNGTTPLMTAAASGNGDIARMLLEKGADTESKGNGDDTPLIQAAYKGHSDVVRMLLDQGANMNARSSNGTTPLMTAAVSGNADIVRMLLEKGADIHARSKDGSTPLLGAAFSHRTEVVRLLLDNGADIEEKGDDGETVLSAAVCFQVDADPGGAAKPGLVKLLLERGANFEVTNKDGLTLLTCRGRKIPAAVDSLLDEAVKQRQQFDEAQSKDPSTAFATYMSVFKQHPQNDSLRERILKIVPLLPEPTAIPEEARQLFIAATDQIKQAGNPAALDQPIALLRKALEIAPWWSNAYYNLSRALEMRGQYDDAARQLNYYLELKPAEADASEARAHLVVLQAEKDAAAHKQ